MKEIRCNFLLKVLKQHLEYDCIIYVAWNQTNDATVMILYAVCCTSGKENKTPSPIRKLVHTLRIKLSPASLNFWCLYAIPKVLHTLSWPKFLLTIVYLVIDSVSFYNVEMHFTTRFNAIETLANFSWKIKQNEDLVLWYQFSYFYLKHYTASLVNILKYISHGKGYQNTSRLYLGIKNYGAAESSFWEKRKF